MPLRERFTTQETKPRYRYAREPGDIVQKQNVVARDIRASVPQPVVGVGHLLDLERSAIDSV